MGIRYRRGPVQLTFTERLARENGWEPAFAGRVVEEYRRFVFLAMTAGHPVTPSEHVDQAWHLHLTYTRSYWERFCNGVLPRPLHHEPTKGGADEGEKFDGQYNRTLESYERAFGDAAPSDIWPPASIRFGHDLQQVRVNVNDVWTIPKPRWGRASVVSIVAIVLAVVGLACAATETSGEENEPFWGSPEFFFLVWSVIIVFGLFYLVRVISGTGIGGGGGKGGWGGCGASCGGGCGGCGGCGGGCGG